ncbi:helix-turn-helix domain-containing protein [Xanthobacter autotrophicus DSM 431]|uniref:helix-turn-helix domain-containing protein n=1 Tax=Xanthobacter nonsaccharivorans TaxID=3119912 RepID=UPI00372A2EB3
MSEEVFLSTDIVEKSLRTDMCRELSRPFFEVMPQDNGPRQLELSLRSHLIGQTLIISTNHSQQRISRDRCHIILGLDQYFVFLMLGGVVDNDFEGGAVSINSGDICFADLSRSFRGEVGQGSALSLMLPRAALDKATGGRDLHGFVLKKGEPITQFLTDFMVSFANLPDIADGTEAQAIEEAAIALIGACISRRAPPQDPALNNVLRHRLLSFVEENLAAPDLGPALLMQRFHVSRAHLYRMFEAEGGVATVIREKRLDAAFRALISPSGRSSSIAQVAYTFGFSSTPQFHRAFQARFSMTPRQARNEASLASSSVLPPAMNWYEYCARLTRKSY